MEETSASENRGTPAAGKNSGVAENGPNSGTEGFKAGRSTYALAWLAETWERLWPTLVWAFSVICVFAAVSWFGLWLRLPDMARFAGLGVFAIVLIASLWPVRNFRSPTRGEILHRIERASGLPHRPVTAQEDSMAKPGDAFSEALWRVHRERMAARLKNLSSGTAKPDATRFDRYAVHAFLPIIAFVAWGFSQTPSGGRLVDAFSPHVDAATVLSRLDAWVDYPDYAAKPPVYLSREIKPEGMRTVSVLTGSELHLRYVGDEDVSLRYIAGDNETELAPEEQGSAGSREAAFTTKLTTSGVVEFLARNKPVARWPLDVIADAVPQIEFSEAPGASQTGSLELSYTVKDDYGVVSARGLVEPVEKPAANARPLVEAPELSLPLPRARAKSGTTRVNRDLSSHPWAGSEVDITLEATDDPGQIGRSAPHRMTLPGRNFTNPLARALVEQRRILAMDANNSRYVADMLDAVSSFPEVFEINAGAYMAMRTAYRMISPGDDDEKLKESLDLLWETALNLELGNLSDVERRLREAQDKLSKALENDASDEEIEKLMEELRQAMSDFLEQLAKEMAKAPQQKNQNNAMNNMQTLTQRDLERMMDRIENLARSGSKDAARELLSEMQRMMDSVMAGRQQQQQQGQQQSQLNQALDKLSELMQRQQQLMDETFSMRQRQPQQGEQQPGGQQGQQSQNRDQQGEGQQREQQGQNQQGQQGGEQGESGPMTPEEFAKAMEGLRQQQEALQQELDQLSEQLMQQGLDPSKEFGEAGQEMGQAGDNLGQGQPGPAAGNQGQALEALRRGAQSMLNQLAQQGQQPGQQPGDQHGPGGQRQSRADPLGRQQQNEGGRFNESGTKIPGEIDAQRAREIMDAIRRRLADPLRPLIERNYLERLLESR